MPEISYPDGTTPIEPDEAEGLLLTHITTRGELDRWEQDNIIAARAWLDRTKPIDILNEKYVKELHKRMFGNVWKWAGQFRRTDKNIGGPWQQISIGLKNLFDDASYWIEHRVYSPEEIAVRFHLENILKCPRFTWGGKDLTGAGRVRKEYISALQAADAQSYGSLLAFVRT